VVVLNFSDAVRGSDVANRVKAWILPKRNPNFRSRTMNRPWDWDPQ